jgi:exodeoxyribonuclease VII small subunit
MLITIGPAKRLTGSRSRVKAFVMTDNANTQPSFEEALKALEEVVHKLESGDAPLDESIALYERGQQLRAICQTRLDAAQARIEAIILGPDGSPQGTRPFDAE